MFKFSSKCRVELFRGLVILPLLFFGHAATALIIPATDTGWYLEDGTHDPDNTNYVTGVATDGIVATFPTEFRNFFVFDVGGVGSFSSAILRAYLPPEFGFDGPGYLSPDATETWGLFDVTTSLFDLMGGSGGVSAFADLGGGIAFGNALVTAGDMGNFVEVSLNADALASIGAAGGLWALGGRLLDMSGADPEVIFASTNQEPRVELVLTHAVPAPTTFYLVSLAFGALYRLQRTRVRLIKFESFR